MSLILIERIANLNGPIIPDTLNGVLNGSEIDAHKFIITAMRDGATVALTGTVTASFLRADGAEVVLTGEIENGAATVTLAKSCYAVPGRFDLTIFVTADGVKTGVYACTGGVRNTTSGTIIDPGQIVPSVDDIIAKQEELAQDVADASSAIASAQNAVSYLAPGFSTLKTYKIGEYVTQDGVLYICTIPVETAGAWNAANWQAVTFGEEITDLTDLKNAIIEPSKNLLPITGNGVHTIRGVNVQYEDGIVTLQGTGTESGGRTSQLFSPITLKAGVYTYSANAQNSIFLQDVSNNIIARLDMLGRRAHTFELASETQVYLGANVVAGQTYDLAFYVQLEKNGSASPWSKPSSFSAIDYYARNILSKTAPAIVETASGAVASFDDGADRMPVQKLIVNIEPAQAGSGDPSPDNVRPISGWTGAVIERTEINVWDEKWENGYIDPYGTLIDNPGYIRSKNYIMVSPGTSYYCKSNEHIMYVCQYDSSKRFISDTRVNATDRVITVRQDCHYIKFNMSRSYGGTYNNNLAINYPSTATSYKPYTGDQISIAFPSSAGTVYGGVLTVNKDGTGSLSVDRAMVNAKDVSWSSTGVNGIYHIFSDKVQSEGTAISSHFVPETYSSSNRVAWNDNTIERADKLAIINGGDVQICYLLATPIAHALTKSEISGILTTRYGTNNIWADTGDVSVEYVADTKLYIEKLTQPTEDDMVADHLITNGTFFMIGNSLYLATAQIAAGATITPGTNATKLSLADALNALNS